jgi:hypothetical protein
VTMQVFVRRDFSMIAAPVQCHVDGVAKGSHSARVPALQAISPGYLRSGIGSALRPSSVVTTCFLSRAHPKEASMEGNRGRGGRRITYDGPNNSSLIRSRSADVHPQPAARIDGR